MRCLQSGYIAHVDLLPSQGRTCHVVVVSKHVCMCISSPLLSPPLSSPPPPLPSPPLPSPVGYTVIRPCDVPSVHSLRRGAELRVWKDVGAILAHRGLGATIGYGSRWDTQTDRHMDTHTHSSCTCAHTCTPAHTRTRTCTRTHTHNTHTHTTHTQTRYAYTCTHILVCTHNAQNITNSVSAVMWPIPRTLLLPSRKQ